MKLMINKMVPAVFLVFVLAGCAGGGASESKPIEQVQKEAQTMKVSQLESIVKDYEEAIKDKSADLESLAAELKGIPIKEMLGSEAKSIKTDMEEIAKSVSALKDRLTVYADALKMQIQKAAQ